MPICKAVSFTLGIRNPGPCTCLKSLNTCQEQESLNWLKVEADKVVEIGVGAISVRMLPGGVDNTGLLLGMTLDSLVEHG